MASKTLGFLACLLILPQIPRLKITHTCKPRLYLNSQVMSYVKVNKVATSAATTRSLHATEVTCTPSFAQSALVVCRTNPKTISLIEMNFHTAERGATLVAAAGRSSRMWRNLAPVCSCGYVCVCVCVWQTLSCRSTKLQWPRAPTKALQPNMGSIRQKAAWMHDTSQDPSSCTVEWLIIRVEAEVSRTQILPGKAVEWNMNLE